MKSVKLIAIAALAFSVMSFVTPINKANIYVAANNTSVAWKSDVLDLGSIPQNKPVTVEFELTNTGDAPLIISNVATSCGCTGSNFEKTPIKPGDKSIVSATYNAAAAGAFSKAITVTFANNETKVLTIKGTVVAQ